MSRKSVIYFDEDEDQRDLFGPRLQVVFEVADVNVVCIEPFGTIGETVRYILEQGDQVCAVVTDERMHEAGTADFKGSELAKELRAFNSILPIYILTTYSEDEDLQESFAEYDYVIDKGLLTIAENIPNKLKLLVSRNVSSFVTAIEKRSIRMNELLEKSIESSLDKEESIELITLINWQRKNTRLLEHQAQTEMQSKITDAENRLNEIQGKLRQLKSQ